MVYYEDAMRDPHGIYTFSIQIPKGSMYHARYLSDEASLGYSIYGRSRSNPHFSSIWSLGSPERREDCLGSMHLVNFSQGLSHATVAEEGFGYRRADWGCNCIKHVIIYSDCSELLHLDYIGLPEVTWLHQCSILQKLTGMFIPVAKV